MTQPISLHILYTEAQALLKAGDYNVVEGTSEEASLNALWFLAEDSYGVALVC